MEYTRIFSPQLGKNYTETEMFSPEKSREFGASLYSEFGAPESLGSSVDKREGWARKSGILSSGIFEETSGMFSGPGRFAQVSTFPDPEKLDGSLKTWVNELNVACEPDQPKADPQSLQKLSPIERTTHPKGQRRRYSGASPADVVSKSKNRMKSILHSSNTLGAFGGGDDKTKESGGLEASLFGGVSESSKEDVGAKDTVASKTGRGTLGSSGAGLAADREVWRNEYADSKRSLDYRNLAGVSIHDDVGIDVMLNPQRTKQYRSDRDGNILGMKKTEQKSKHSLSLLSGGGSQVGGSTSNLQSGVTGTTTTKTISHLHQHHLDNALNNSDLVISDSIGADGFLGQSPSKNRGGKKAAGPAGSNYSPNKLLQQTGLGSLDSSVMESPGRMSTRSSKGGAMSSTSRGGFGVGGGLGGSGSSFQFRTPKLTKAKPLPPRPEQYSVSPDKKNTSQFSSTHSGGFGNISQSSPTLDPGSPFGGRLKSQAQVLPKTPNLNSRLIRMLGEVTR